MKELIENFLNYLSVEKGYSGHTIAAYRNDLTGLAMTLLDVLSGIDTIKVCRAYRCDGTETTGAQREGRRHDPGVGAPDGRKGVIRDDRCGEQGPADHDGRRREEEAQEPQRPLPAQEPVDEKPHDDGRDGHQGVEDRDHQPLQREVGEPHEKSERDAEEGSKNRRPRRDGEGSADGVEDVRG